MIMSEKMSILTCSCKTDKTKKKHIYQNNEVFLCDNCIKQLNNDALHENTGLKNEVKNIKNYPKYVQDADHENTGDKKWKM